LAAVVAGDKDAIQVVRSASEGVGATLGLLVNVLDPEAIVVGGGLGTAGGMYWESLIRSTREHIWSKTHRQLPIVKAKYGGDAGFVGAAALAHRRVRASNP
jgi:glucokinase